jgi:hypothetical protein
MASASRVTLSPRRSSEVVIPPLEFERGCRGRFARFAGHEAAGEAPGEAVAPQEVEHTLLLRQPQ